MSKKILLIGDEKRIDAFKNYLNKDDLYEIDISDGDEEEDYELYDLIADLNFDDNDENMEIYAGLKDKIVLVSSVKQSLSESIYKTDGKLKCKLFGINSIPAYINTGLWEISAYRYPEYVALEEFLSKSTIKIQKVLDRVGMLRPRLDFLLFNELALCLQEQVSLSHDPIDPIIENYVEAHDKYSTTDIFESLMAIYEDTKEERFHPCPFLKTKYLRNQSLIKRQK